MLVCSYGNVCSLSADSRGRRAQEASNHPHSTLGSTSARATSELPLGGGAEGPQLLGQSGVPVPLQPRPRCQHQHEAI